MEDAKFKELFQKIVDQYELTPDAASQLLQRILAILKNAAVPPDSQCEILIQYLESEEMI